MSHSMKLKVVMVEQEKRMYEVLAVTKRYDGSDGKSRLQSYLVVANSEESAYDQVEEWYGHTVTGVAIKIAFPVNALDEVATLTDAELALLETQGYGALELKRWAEREAMLAGYERAEDEQLGAEEARS